MSNERTDKEFVEILVDWHKYAHGGGMIGACNNDKCQAALAEIKTRILRRPGPSGAEVDVIQRVQFIRKWRDELNVAPTVSTGDVDRLLKEYDELKESEK